MRSGYFYGTRIDADVTGFHGTRIGAERRGSRSARLRDLLPRGAQEHVLMDRT
jgi:hypothetical protein